MWVFLCVFVFVFGEAAVPPREFQYDFAKPPPFSSFSFVGGAGFVDQALVLNAVNETNINAAAYVKPALWMVRLFVC